jgi:hypothetical protein
MKVILIIITLCIWVADTHNIICQPINSISADWSFKDCSSNDKSTNNYHATQHNGIVCLPHNNINVLYFDGKDDFCNVGDVQLFDENTSITILTWVKPDNIKQRADQFQCILTKWENQGGPQEWWFGLCGDEIHFTTQNYPCASYCPEFMSKGLSLNCWSLIGIRLSRKNSSLTLVEYIKDGKVFDKDSSTYFFSTQPTSVRIGRQNPDDRPVGHYQGSIARITVYAKALTNNEILEYYTATYPEIVSKSVTIFSCLGDTVTLPALYNNSTEIQYKWTPSQNLSCSSCASPKTVFNKKSYYSVEIISKNSCIEKYTYLIDTLHQKQTVRFYTSDNKEITPDFEPFEIATRLVVEDKNILTNLRHIKTKIGFKKNHMIFDSLKPIRFHKTIASSWQATTNIYHTKDSVFVDILSQGIEPLTHTDTIFFIPFISLLGDTERFTPHITFDFDSTKNSCLMAESNSGTIILKGCAISMRTITTSSTPTSLHSLFRNNDNVIHNDFSLSFPSSITFTVIDVLGNIIYSENEYYNAGYHNNTINAQGLANGQYYICLTTNRGKYFSSLLLYK